MGHLEKHHHQLLIWAIAWIMLACGAPEAPRPLSDRTVGGSEQTSDSRTGPESAGTNKAAQGDASIGNASGYNIPYGFVLWQMDCTQAYAAGQGYEGAGFFRMDGEGDHNADRTKVARSRLQVQGKLCDPSLHRNVVLAVDVGRDNNYACGVLGLNRCGPDISANNTCGRAAYIKQVSQWAETNHVNLGYVTFNGSRQAKSTGLAFKASALTDRQLADIFCDNAGNPDWAVPLTEAETLLSAAKSQETKEIYVVSAADIPAGQMTAVAAKAKTMKENGHHINVVLMNGPAGTVAASAIASMGRDSKAFVSRVADGGALSSVVAPMEVNQTVGQLVKVRAIGDTEWKEIAFTANDSEPEFMLDTGYDLDGDTVDAGFEVELIQQDLRARTRILNGRLLMAAKPKP